MWVNYSCLRFTNSPSEGAGVTGALDSGARVTGASVNGAGLPTRIPHIIEYTARRGMCTEAMRYIYYTHVSGTHHVPKGITQGATTSRATEGDGSSGYQSIHR